MAFYVFITEACKSDAQKHGKLDALTKHKCRVENTQQLDGFQFYLPTKFIKKCIGGNLRLIGYSKRIENDELVLFLRLLPRGDKEYNYFLANWDNKEDKVVRRFIPYSEEDLKQIYHDLTRVPPLPSPPEPSAEERAWLYEVFSWEGLGDDLIVLETEEWVRKMRTSQNREFLALYHQMLEEMILYQDQLHAATGNTDFDRKWDRNNRLGIAYLYRQDLKRLLLLEPLRHNDNTDAILDLHLERLSRIEDGQYELSRIAARSYPSLMVLELDDWLAIQRDEEANLALSPEEAELLDSIRRMGAEDQLGYPLFINGRAGSGKSTMLQYLAADYLDFALRRKLSQQMLYLTSSPDLVERARKIVRSLLTTHHTRLLKEKPERSAINAAVERSFKVFHDFLYSLLPPEVQNQLPQDKYVDYARFRRLWEKEFARWRDARDMSPDISWHILRTYIKGIRSGHDDEFSPEEFYAFPRRRKSVTHATYKQVYERVWCSWYKRLCDEKNYWDDQDLAAWVLDQDISRKVDCAAIFCDEAQDFTPLELDIIFQFSLFGRRSLQPEELRRVPIVFAGDPLQTINPTGFRWDAVKEDFYDRFRAILDPHRKAHVDITYKELNFNYRSNSGIVKFCNLIQLVRAKLLGISNIHPQESWWVDEPIQTFWFVAENEATKQGLRKRPDLVKLVNCEAGEENDYVENDEILKKIQDKEEGIYRNVFSPMRAKGLEFPGVVLYRFGETAPGDFEKLMEGKVNLDEPEARLPFEYFFNRLYVAASRAKGQLAIVDSDYALRKFWGFIIEICEGENRLMEKAWEIDKWQNHIAYPVPGTEKWWVGGKIDPLQQGEEYEREGRAKHDPYLLRQAALAYRSISDKYAEGKCIAAAYEFEGNYIKAGDKYREVGLRDDAYKCYWIGQGWPQIKDLTAEDSRLASRLESRAADFMAQQATLPEAFIEELIKAAHDEAWLQQTIRPNSTWHLVAQEVARRLQKVKELPKHRWINLWSTFTQLGKAGICINLAHLALIAYKAEELSKAVELWEKSGDTEKGEYLDAKARSTHFPENIIWYARLRRYDEILHQWRENHATVSDVGQIGESAIRAVVDAAIEKHDIRLALDLLNHIPNDKHRVYKVLHEAIQVEDANISRLNKSLIRTALHAAIEKSDPVLAVEMMHYWPADRKESEKVLNMVIKKQDPDLVLKASVLVARMFVRTRDWKAAIKAAENLDFSTLSSEIQAGDIQGILQPTGQMTAVFQAVVEELAISEALPLEITEHRDREQVGEFLNRHFISREGTTSDLRGLPPEVVGAAIERAGKIIDALQFYENLLRNASTEEMREFAAERLIRNYERHAEYFRNRGDEIRAYNKEASARGIRQKYGLGDREIPEYPSVLNSIAQAEPTERFWGAVKIFWMKQHRRLRLEHLERSETVSVYVDELNMRGEAMISEVKCREGEFKAWKVNDWNMRIALIEQGTSKLVVIESEKERIEFPIK